MIAADKLINKTVMHKVFKEGIIRNADDKYLEVDFAEKGKVSKFSYPSCFSGFLTLEDCSLQAEIDADVEVWKQESGAAQKEILRHRYEKTMHSIEARRLASEEKKIKAAQKSMNQRFAYSGNGQEKKEPQKMAPRNN